MSKLSLEYFDTEKMSKKITDTKHKLIAAHFSELFRFLSLSCAFELWSIRCTFCIICYFKFNRGGEISVLKSFCSKTFKRF